MTQLAALNTLDERHAFRSRRAEAWQHNVVYWLRGPLRHVVDVGEYIAERTAALCGSVRGRTPVVVDMGCGDAWLWRCLRAKDVPLSYIGLDYTSAFVEAARREFAASDPCTFEVVDLELPSQHRYSADVVVNAFNFFELCDLEQGFANAACFLRPGGTLFVSTIDKTYLLLALSRDWDDLMEKLRVFNALSGVKYAFQPIDLGDQASEVLVYPSVLYSTEDYLSAARANGLRLCGYKESVFTARPIPKIYCHLEFQRL